MKLNKLLLDQLSRWHEEEEFQKIVEAILAIPENERDYNLSGQLARALNNLEDYETAVEVLLSVEKEGTGDPLWHYRLGYAYYYSAMFQQAKTELEQVLKIHPEDEDARMLLESCEEELSPTVKTDRLNQRLMAAEVMMAGVSFRQRADAFWEWFAIHENKLAEIIEKRGEHDTAKAMEFISEGVRIISEDVNFNIGGNYEFTFAAEGNNYLFYLLPWLIARMPVSYRSKWHFFPYMQGTDGENFDFQMYDKKISLEEVMVGLHYDEEEDYCDLRFYHPELSALADEPCYHAFHLMMELAIGEGLSRIYIRQVKKADRVEAGMFPLTKLQGCMTMAIEEAGKAVLTRPDERYTVYRMDFDELKDLRYDMLIGSTCFTELVNDYFSGQATTADQLEDCGAKAVFLVIPFNEPDRPDLLKLRYEIEDGLVAEVLGERGSGQEIGILLGGAAGQENLYIDILLYDAFAFMDRATEFLMQYPYPFYLAEYRPEGRLVAMAGVEADIPEIPDEPTILARRMMAYMDCSCDWFAPMPDAVPLDQAYFAALKAGQQGGYIPVLVKVHETLMKHLIENVGIQGEEENALGKIRDYRHRMLEEMELPDAEAYFEKMVSEHYAGKFKKICREELLQEGTPNNDLSAYWNYDTRLTDEILLVRVPVEQPWKIFAWLPMGNWHDCPDTPLLMAIAKHWYEEYGAIPAVVTHEELEFYMEKPLDEQRQMFQLAREHYVFSPDCIEHSQMNGSIGKRADALPKSTVWYFWWA